MPTRRRTRTFVYTRVPGHELRHDGAPHDDDGHVIPPGTRTGGLGRARCTCGALSQVTVSATRRRQWHREHKAQVIA
jgi:hypothetical protein